MQRFKSIILPMQGHSKSELHWLYNIEHKTNSEDEEKEKVFSYYNLRFWFRGTSRRNTEKLILYVEIPGIDISDIVPTDALPYENYLLKVLSPLINIISDMYSNTDKNIREKAQFSSQTINCNILHRNGMNYDRENNVFIYRINFNVPLVNAISVNSKATIRAVKDILEHIKEAVNDIDKQKLNKCVAIYKQQQEIREYLKKHSLCAFIADGSILPRENGTEQPMKNAIPFISPEDLHITIPLSDGSKISGMAIKQGVTIITGGGYSGKSTLLDAIEMGIYNHTLSDGREFCITDNTAIKIYAEDGRPINNLDMSPFFKYLPNTINIEEFSTLHASGSVSQAANIIEAVCGGSKLLLIDEDKSATNFMIHDQNMRKIVKHEPIIPFTDRVKELYSKEGISTVLVIGGSSEYLSYADTVILMDDYNAFNITDEIKTLNLPCTSPAEKTAHWTKKRSLLPIKNNKPFTYFSTVKAENQKKIILDDYVADITLLTSLVSGDQMNTLVNAIEELLSERHDDNNQLIKRAEQIVDRMHRTSAKSLLSDIAQIWYEEIRPLDIFCCANRMRGLNFQK